LTSPGGEVDQPTRRIRAPNPDNFSSKFSYPRSR
jgi:hypothetical protein